MVVAIVAAIDIGVGMAIGQVGMGVVGVASVGKVVEVVRVGLSIGDWLSIRGGLCLSVSVGGPLTNVVVVAVVTSEGIWVTVVCRMGIGKMGVWVDVAMVQVVEVVGVSFSISSCISFRSSFCVSISRPLAMVMVAIVASEGIWVAVVGRMGIGKMGVWVDMPMVVEVEVVGVSLSLGSSSCLWSSNCLRLSSSFCRSSSNKEKSSGSL